MIVGAGPAGLAAAESYRRHGGTAELTLIGADPDPPYRRPPLSKEFLRGEIGRRELALRDPRFYVERRIELRCGTAADGIDPASGTLLLADGERIRFDRCVIATGARPAVPDVAGLARSGCLVLRSRADSERLRTAATGRVLVVGSGFIGCEAAASLALAGARVTLATDEELPQAARLGARVGERIAGWLEQLGVEIRAAAPLERTSGDGPISADLGGRTVEADAILLALGIVPNAELAESAGLELDGGRIPVDERMRTGGGGILAAGDVCLAENAAAGRALAVEHWGEALRHGEIAGATLAGVADRWASAPGFWSTIGRRTLKYVAWGDGYEDIRLDERAGGGFVTTYGREGRIVGVLAHGDDEAYESGRELVESGAAW